MQGMAATVVVGPRQFKAVKKNRKVYHLIPHILECTAPLLLLLLDQEKTGTQAKAGPSPEKGTI